MTWSAPSNQGTSPITGYDVYVGTVPGGEYAEPANGPQPVAGTSYLVSNLTVGTTYYFTVKAINAVGLSAPSNEVAATPGNSYRSVGTLATPVVSMTANPQGTGYWLANSGGAVATHGDVSAYGSTAGLHLNAPIVQIVATSDGKGYWEVASDGGIFAFGDAGFYGSMGGVKINAPVVGLTPTADGNGYWEVASDGGIFAFGDAGFDGSMGGVPLDAPGGGAGPRSRQRGLLGGGQRRRRLRLRRCSLPRFSHQPGTWPTRWWASPPPPTARATGRWPATAASSRTVRPPSKGRPAHSISMHRWPAWRWTREPAGTGCSPWTVASSPSEPRSMGPVDRRPSVKSPGDQIRSASRPR